MTAKRVLTQIAKELLGETPVSCYPTAAGGILVRDGAYVAHIFTPQQVEAAQQKMDADGMRKGQAEVIEEGAELKEQNVRMGAGRRDDGAVRKAKK